MCQPTQRNLARLGQKYLARESPERVWPRGLRNCLSKFGMVRNRMLKILWNRFGMEFIKFRGMVRHWFGIKSRLRPRNETLWNVCAAGGQHSWTFTSLFGSLSWTDFSRNFRIFRNSRNCLVRHSSVSEILIPNRISEFRRPLVWPEKTRTHVLEQPVSK